MKQYISVPLFLLFSAFLASCANNQKAVIHPIVSTQASVNLVSYYDQPIQVTLKGGTVDFHDIVGFAAYQPITVTLKNKQLLTQTLTKSGNNFFNSTVDITLYYANGILYIDYAANNKQDPGVVAAKFTLSKSWLTGATYQNINTYGIPKMRGATLMVKVI